MEVNEKKHILKKYKDNKKEIKTLKEAGFYHLAKTIEEENIKIENAIFNLTDPIERTVLERLFLIGEGYKMVAINIKYSESQTRRFAEKAIKKIKF